MHRFRKSTIRLALAGLALASISVAAAPSASANTSTPSVPPAVTIVGNAHGLTLQSQHTNPDGTVTSAWKNSAGQGFTYAGQAGARVTISPSVTTVAGTTVHVMSLSVAPPAHAPGTAKAAAAAYAAAGRSVLNDALNSGVDPALARAKFGPGTKYASPHYTSGGDRINSWCTDVYGSGLIGQYLGAHGCVTEYLAQSSPEYISDDMEVLGYSTNQNIPFSGVEIYSDYRSGTVVPPWIPNGGQGTDCNNVTASASWGPFSFSSSSSICGGGYVIDLAHNTFGMHWSGESSSQVGLEPVDVVSVPNGDDYTDLHVNLWWG